VKSEFGRRRNPVTIVRAGPWVVALAATAWLAGVWTAPRWVHSDRAGARVAARVVYAAGARVCHQRAERSFAWGGAAWPVCARCTGLYAGGALGALMAALAGATGLGSAARARRVLGLALLPTAVAWAAEWLVASQVGNAARAVTALPGGAAAGWLLAAATRAWHGEASRRRGEPAEA
jgi:uncharacterized membrane protein